MTINSFNRGRSLSRITRGVTGVANVTATGGIISDYDDGSGNKYRAHIFTSTGNLNVTDVSGIVAGSLSYNPSRDRKIGQTVSANTDYLVVAGGGGNEIGQGGNRESGSGAGGMLTGNTPASVASYPIQVGGGGGGKSNGTPSYFGPITALGGGHGANFDSQAGNPGGSGGGNWYSGATPGQGTPGQGNPGGIWGGINNWSGGGGGGAGGPGGVSPTNPSIGTGGPGLPSSITGTNVTYAAGGTSSYYPSTPNAANGTPATGNGASGAANGGSGIVVARYRIGSLTATAKATGGAISYYGGKTIHTFTSSGTFTVTNPSLTSVEYVIVAGGGGGGGRYNAGGGGAGGYLTGPAPVSPGPYTITVGAGGEAGRYPGTAGTNGTSSSAFSVPTTGGGGGGTFTPGTGQPGGSGGGAGPQNGGASGGTGVPGQGNPGGSGEDGNTFPYRTGGGGGAGGAGSNFNSPTPAYGGIGVQLPSTFRNPVSSVGTPGPGGAYYVAGGGAGSIPASALGGAGGGGNGGDVPVSSVRGIVNTGGGGGGGGPYTPPASNTGDGRGGSGIVLIAYPS